MPVPKDLIERDIPGAGQPFPQELQATVRKSCSVLNKLGPQMQWLQSYVADEKVSCVPIAPNEEVIREHTRQGRFPANRISEVQASSIPPLAAPDR